MRIPTSIYSVKAALGDYFKVLASKYEESSGKSLEEDSLGWHWVLNELDVPMPRSAAALLKSNPVQHLAVCLSHAKYELKINIKPETGKVWVSAALPRSIAPSDVAEALRKRTTPSSSAKWNGVLVDIFMPMHQKHPGLTEHAIVGAINVEGEPSPIYIISDRPDPLSASMWHLFKFHPERRVAQALLTVMDKNGQKDFRSTLIGQEFLFKDFNGIKMSDMEIIESLQGIKKFAWRTDPGNGVSSIPLNARKFKLGEELSLQESKSIPAAAFVGLLEGLVSK